MNIPRTTVPGADLALRVGDPCTVQNQCVIVTVQCNCEGKSPLLIAGLGTATICPHCKRGRAIKQFHFDAIANQLMIEVADVIVDVPAGAKPVGAHP